MALEYLREYRTYFHIGQSYDISESSAYKAIRWIEDTLIKHPDVALPGKKVLVKSDIKYELVLSVASKDGLSEIWDCMLETTLATKDLRAAALCPIEVCGYGAGMQIIDR